MRASPRPAPAAARRYRVALPPAERPTWRRLSRGHRCSPPAAAAAAPPSAACAEPPLALLERLVRESSSASQGWEALAGPPLVWARLPPAGAPPPRLVVHFVGGAFAGAAPQLLYRSFLEALFWALGGGAAILACPYATGFDHLQAADEVAAALEGATRALEAAGRLQPGAPGAGPSLPVWSVGHSQGALLLALGSGRAAPAAGRVRARRRPRRGGARALSPPR